MTLITLWLAISLCIMSSSFIHAAAGVRIPFLFTAESRSTVWVDRTLLLHSSMDGQLDCIHFSAVVSHAAGGI